MAISTRTSNFAAFNLRYSAFLGMLYVTSDVIEAAIKDVKAQVGGEAEVKKGYQGNTGNSASAQAIASLRSQGVVPASVHGTLTSARVVNRDVDGRPTPYLNVGLKDADGRYYISVALAQSGAQMLARKLANCVPGVETEISMFATYGAKPGAPRAYADHGASVKQGGVEVKGVNPSLALKPMIEAAIKQLEDAGVTKASDKETVNRRRTKVEVDFHVKLMEDVNKVFAEHYAQTEQPVEDTASAGHPDDEVPY
jgi:hypothetical protein